MSFSLTYLDRYKIEYETEGLTEPSGLSLTPDNDGLWTVSDDTKMIFKLDLEGRLEDDESFEIPVKGLEGVTADPGGAFLLAAKEETNEIIKIEIAEREITDRRRLADMAGYDTIEPFFRGDGENKGLEGITWNTDTDTVFVMKEGEPGLLVEVSADLRTIRAHRLLTDENGFRDPGLRNEDIDFSGICYDDRRTAFWIVSDKAQRLYLYDWAGNQVLQSSTLGYAKDGEYREVKKAEGVAVDPGRNRLYVASDEEVRLYVFDLRG
ncbi:MAG: SdiA-regulated domain-containing protein [Alphaproteobacteria bacterium]|nr:SdiA-regulated domain-containing protein [Alphaproteobacteria bacterium]